MRLLVATTNPGKFAEIRKLLAGLPIRIDSLDKYPGIAEAEEPGSTFAENARVKALHYSRLTGQLAVAEDSGLELEALDGAPGVYTADWATLEDGSRDFQVAMQKVEDALQARGATDPAKRTGRFVSVLCLAQPDGDVSFYRGEAEGTLVWPPRGTLGFGYDPVFQPEGHKRTFGEMPSEEKHGWKPGDAEALSHRARAFKKFAEECLGLTRA